MILFLITLIVFLAILSVLIISHEFGHFIAAKKMGMRVDEFAFGFPPRLFKYKKGETTYSFNAIPFGGFVKIHGENGGEEDKERQFVSKSKKAQAVVISAGVIFNFLLAWLLFSIGFMIGFPVPVDDSNVLEVRDKKVIITNVFVDSPAEVADLRVGDAFKKVTQGDTEITVSSSGDVSRFIEGASIGEITFLVDRGGEERMVTILPEQGILEGKQAIGISLETIGLLSLPVHEAAIEGFIRTGQFIWLTTKGFGNIIKDAVVGDAGLESISGPIGIYSLVGQAQDLGFTYLLGFTALISISLGIINLVPLPVLDGGRLLFLIIEAIKGSPIRPQIANGLNYFGIAILILLMILVSYGDLIRIGVLG